MAQLADAIAHINARELDQNEAALAACFPRPPELSEAAKQRVVPFVRWCEAQRVRPLPSRPTSVAAFICWQQDQGISRQVICETLSAIESLHTAAALGNPVAAPIVTATRRAAKVVEEGRQGVFQNAPVARSRDHRNTRATP